MKIEKNTQGNVLIKNEDDSIEHIIATDAFIQKHPRNEDAVLISKTATNQQELDSIQLFVSRITEVSGSAFTGNRNDLLEALATLFSKGGGDGAGSQFSGDYNDLTNKPDLDAKANSSDVEGIVNQASINSLLEPITENYINQNAEGWYEISLPKQGENLDWDETTNKVSKIYDKTLSQTHANQTNDNLRVTLGQNTQNKRRYLNFTGNNRYITDINLNSENVCCVIVQKLAVRPPSVATWGGMFGHDNGGWDRFAYFSWRGFAIGGGSGEPTRFSSQTNANPTTTTINCISVGWYGTQQGASEAWCNGKLLGTFTGSGNVGSNQMTLGDLTPGGSAGFNGNIYEFIVFKNRLSRDQTRQIHEFLRRKWGIGHWDPIDLTLTGS